MCLDIFGESAYQTELTYCCYFCSCHLCSFYHFSHNLRHQRLCVVGSNLHLLVTNLYRGIFNAKVGDDAHAEHLDATVVCHDDFWHGAHAHSVSSHAVVHLIFSRRLECRSLHPHVYAMLYLDAFFFCNLGSRGHKGFVVSLMHVWKTRTSMEVLAAQLMLREKVDMVCDNHQVADAEVRIHTARCIADEEGLDAQFVHDAYRECHLFHIVAFIVMESAFHCHDIFASKLAENQFSCMTFYC